MVVPDRSAQSDGLVERETAGLSRLQSYKEESTMIDAIYGFLQGLGYGHPLHPPLTHLPMGLVIASFVFAVLSLLISQRALLQTAYHCTVLALLALVPTAVTGLMDWAYRYGSSMDSFILAKMVLAPLLFVVLLVALWQYRAGASPGRMLLLYAIASACAAGLGFSGDELVYGG